MKVDDKRCSINFQNRTSYSLSASFRPPSPNLDPGETPKTMTPWKNGEKGGAEFKLGVIVRHCARPLGLIGREELRTEADQKAGSGILSPVKCATVDERASMIPIFERTDRPEGKGRLPDRPFQK